MPRSPNRILNWLRETYSRLSESYLKTVDLGSATSKAAGVLRGGHSR